MKGIIYGITLLGATALASCTTTYEIDIGKQYDIALENRNQATINLLETDKKVKAVEDKIKALNKRSLEEISKDNLRKLIQEIEKEQNE